MTGRRVMTHGARTARRLPGGPMRLETLFLSLTTALVAANTLHTEAVAAPPTSVSLDGQTLAVRFGPWRPSPSQPMAQPRVVAGATHYRVELAGRMRRLSLEVRRWRVLAESAGPAPVTVLVAEDGFRRRGHPGQTPHALVYADGRVVRFALPEPVANRHTICGDRTLVGVAKLGGTVIYDLVSRRVVARIPRVGVHDRADHYGGPACSPDGRFVAVPDTFAKAVHIFRLVDGHPLAALTFDPNGDSPAFVNWVPDPDPDRALTTLTVGMVPDPIALNPPK